MDDALSIVLRRRDLTLDIAVAGAGADIGGVDGVGTLNSIRRADGPH